MNLKKKSGSIENFIAIMLITLISLFVLFGIKSKEINVISNTITDAVTSSNLAAATIDLKEYGSTNKIVNNQFDKTFNKYEEALKENLNLDNNLISKDSNMINGKVTIETFAIYNVDGNDVHMIKRQQNGNILKEIYKDGLGNTRTPNGVLVETTTIYSRVGMNLKGYMKDVVYGFKEGSVDITDKH